MFATPTFQQIRLDSRHAQSATPAIDLQDRLDCSFAYATRRHLRGDLRGRDYENTVPRGTALARPPAPHSITQCPGVGCVYIALRIQPVYHFFFHQHIHSFSALAYLTLLSLSLSSLQAHPHLATSSSMEHNNVTSSIELASAGPAVAPSIINQTVADHEPSSKALASATAEPGLVSSEQTVHEVAPTPLPGTTSFWRFNWLCAWPSCLLAKLAKLELGSLFATAACVRPYLFTLLAVSSTIILVISWFDVSDFSTHPNALLYNCVSTLSSLALVYDQSCKVNSARRHNNARRHNKAHKARVYLFSLFMTSSLTIAAWIVWDKGTLRHDYELLRTASCLFKAVEVMVIFVLAGRSNAVIAHDDDLQLRNRA